MRRALPWVCLLLVSGCGLGAGGSLTASDATHSLAAKDSAVARLARTQLSVVAQAAQGWAAAHGGSTTGFADDLRSSQPSLVSTLTDLTDTSATIAVAPGRCLTEQLPAGAPAAAAC